MDDEKKDSIHKKIRWIKIGGGIHTLANGKKIKKNQKFLAFESEISLSVRDIIKPLEPLPSQNKQIKSMTKFEIRPANISGKGGWFNVVNLVSGKAMTTKAMRQEKALKLLQELA